MSQKLYNLVFSPLKKELAGKTNLFMSPDSQLNLMPFEILKGPDNRFLIQDYLINYISSGRDLLGFKQSKQNPGKILIIGDPDFDLKKASCSDHPETETKTILDRAYQGLSFSRLPGTKKEAEAVY
jgi:CHAT domain-containing protein